MWFSASQSSATVSVTGRGLPYVDPLIEQVIYLFICLSAWRVAALSNADTASQCTALAYTSCRERDLRFVGDTGSEGAAKA